MRNLLFVLAVLLTFTLMGQKNFEVSLGEGGSNQQGYDIVATDDGGCIIAGVTKENGMEDILVVKINSNGEVIKKEVLGMKDKKDWAKSICKTKLNRYVVCGNSYSYAKWGAENSQNAFMASFDNNLVSLGYPKAFGGAETNSANTIFALGNGYLLINVNSTFKEQQVGLMAGRTTNEFQLRMVDTSGKEIWKLGFDELGEGFGQSITQTADGSIYFTGNLKAKSNGRSIFVCRLDPDGKVSWNRRLTVEAGTMETVRRICESEDGNLLLVGQARVNNVSSPLFIKLNPNGDVLLRKSYYMKRSTGAVDLVELNDGTILITGHSYGFKPFILHVDKQGNLLSNYDLPVAVNRILSVGSTGKFVLLGDQQLENKKKNIFVKKTDLDGLKKMSIKNQ